MNILQISAPKSGSYWLYKILNLILQKGGYPPSSFIQQQSIYKEAQQWPLSYKEQAGIDMMDIEEEGCFYRISSAYRKPVLKPAAYASSCSQAWTHSTLCSSSFTTLPLFKKVVYIVRDPRDRALSAARFAFSPYMQQFYPSTSRSAREYLENNFEKLMERWVWHVANYLYYQKELGIKVVFYERLLQDFEASLKSLLEYLEIDLSEKEQQEVADEVAFSSMQRSAPGHVRKGKSNKWANELTEDQQRRSREIAGPLLHMLSYPLLKEEIKKHPLPAFPLDAGYKDKLKSIIQEIDWYPLYS